MFKKVLQSISKSLSSKTPAVAPAPAAKPAPAKSKAAAAEQTVAKAESVKEKVSTAAPVKVAQTPKPAAPKSAEELCGIEPKMNKEQVRERLKLLYRRHNRAASSLDSQTRSEADGMLEAIVQIREKFFGEI